MSSTPGRTIHSAKTNGNFMSAVQASLGLKTRGAFGWNAAAAVPELDFLQDTRTAGGAASVCNPAARMVELQALMADHAGPFRTEARLRLAAARLEQMRADVGPLPIGHSERYDMVRLDWLDLRNMLLVAQSIVLAALERTESRGAHQREDFPGLLPEWQLNQILSCRDGRLGIRRAPVGPVAQAST